jgi:hypothetical protein
MFAYRRSLVTNTIGDEDQIVAETMAVLNTVKTMMSSAKLLKKVTRSPKRGNTMTVTGLHLDKQSKTALLHVRQ